MLLTKRHGHAGGVDVAAEQRLADINITEAYNQPLIKESSFDRSALALHEAVQIRACQVFRQWLNAETTQKTVRVFLICWNKIHHSEPAWIHETRAGAVLRFQHQMFMFGWSRVHPGRAEE